MTNLVVFSVNKENNYTHKDIKYAIEQACKHKGLDFTCHEGDTHDTYSIKVNHPTQAFKLGILYGHILKE